VIPYAAGSLVTCVIYVYTGFRSVRVTNIDYFNTIVVYIFNIHNLIFD